MNRKLLFPLFVVALLGLAATSAVADVDEGTFDDDGFVSSDGRHVTTQVSVECDEGERYFIRLTITQDDTGALAQVRQPGECTGDEEDLLGSGAPGVKLTCGGSAVPTRVLDAYEDGTFRFSPEAV